MKMTKKNSLLIAVLLLTGAANVYSMKISPFPFTDLPRDMQNEIIVIMAKNEINSLPQEPASLKIAAAKIRELAVSNKDLNEIINRPQFTLKIIKNFAKAFHCFEGVVAKELATRGAQEHHRLQEDFLEDAVAWYEQFSTRVFDSFVKRGVDLEWVDLYGNTPLMTAVSSNKLAGVKALIKQGVDVNQKIEGRDSDGNPVEGTCNTALGRVMTKNISPEYEIKKAPINQVLEIIRVLLEAGADPRPECEVELQRLEFYSDRPAVIKAIVEAQIKKRAAQE